MAGLINPSITQRINNLKDGVDLTTKGDKITGKEIDLTGATPEEIETIAKFTGIKD